MSAGKPGLPWPCLLCQVPLLSVAAEASARETQERAEWLPVAFSLPPVLTDFADLVEKQILTQWVYGGACIPFSSWVRLMWTI